MCALKLKVFFGVYQIIKMDHSYIIDDHSKVEDPNAKEIPTEPEEVEDKIIRLWESGNIEGIRQLLAEDDLALSDDEDSTPTCTPPKYTDEEIAKIVDQIKKDHANFTRLVESLDVYIDFYNKQIDDLKK